MAALALRWLSVKLRAKNQQHPLMKRLLSLPSLLLLLLALSCGPGLQKAAAQNADDQEDPANREVLVTLGRDGWMTYENARFGGIIPVPPGMKSDDPPYNGDGQRFHSLDEKVTLVMYGAFNVEGNGDLEKRWKEDLAEEGRTITYKRKTADWFVISGVMKDGTAFYQRYTANSKYIAGWSITYPHAEEKKYSAWVERIAKGYQPRLGKGEDTLE